MTYDLKTLLPQKYPMLLIDQVLENSMEKLVAQVRITRQSFGFESGGVPSWFGVEYMAQAIAAYNGINYASNGEPEIGFLVGVRDYRTTVSLFALDSELEIAIVPNFVADNSGSFVGEIKINAEVVVTAVITTFKSTPDLLEKMKKESAENIHE